MASWMIHLRVADKLLDRIENLSPIEFIMGNLAPDSGAPQADGSFYPDQTVSHFRLDDGSGKKMIDLEAYTRRYFSPALIPGYDEGQYAFHLGYYCHLLTDICWSDRIAWPTRLRFPDADWANIKKDWYDLDRLYLKKRPGFRAFRAYLGSVGFLNRYVDFFPADAFELRREAVTSFYLEDDGEPDRVYTYLSEDEANRFVDDCTAYILEVLKWSTHH